MSKIKPYRKNKEEHRVNTKLNDHWNEVARKITREKQLKKYWKRFSDKLYDEFYRRIRMLKSEGKIEDKGYFIFQKNNYRKAYQSKLLKEVLADFQKEKEDRALIDRKLASDKNSNQSVGFENAELDNLNKAFDEKRQSNPLVVPKKDRLKVGSDEASEEIQESKELLRNERGENKIEKEFDLITNEEKERLEFEVIEKLKYDYCLN